MINRKMVALGVACTLLFSCTGSYLSKVKAATEGGHLIQDDFENGLNGWGARSTAKAELSSEEAHSGENSIKVTDRTNTWDGATCDKSEILEPGSTYDFGIWVKYKGDSYGSSQRFSLQLQYNDGESEQYKTIKTGEVNKDQWGFIEGEYTIPSDATEINVYVESEFKSSPSKQDLMDFYLDDFTAKAAAVGEIETNIPSLKEAYESMFKIGCASTAGELDPPMAKALIRKHFNSLTFGNELKPDSVLDYNATVAYMKDNSGNQENPQVSLKAAKSLLKFAAANDIPVRGHTLVWHSQTPEWFFKVDYSKDANAAWVSKAVMLKRMENYIKNVMNALATNYPDVKFYAWDVVNEAVEPNNSTGMRNAGSNVSAGESMWMKTVGADFIEKAFEYARKYAPEGCKLFYNDYNEYESKKCDFICDILKNLKAKKLVDGMGMQSHWNMDYPSMSMFETSIKKYIDLGMEIQLTEFDMKQPNNSASALNAQANRYRILFKKLIELKKQGANISAVVFWGITDTTSWIGGYPLLFDGQYKAKPAFYSIAGEMTEITTPTPTPGETGDVKPGVAVTTKNNGNSVSQQYTVTAQSGTIDFSKLSIVYTADGFSNEAHNTWCDTAALELTAEPWYVSMNDSVKLAVADKNLKISFDESSSSQLSKEGGKLTMDIRFAKKDWSTYGTLSNPVLNVYYDGKKIQ